jgi:hypothetical protein
MQGREVLEFCFARKPGAIPCCPLENWRLEPVSFAVCKEGIPPQGRDADSPTATQSAEKAYQR